MNNEEQRAVCPQKGYWVSPQKEKKSIQIIVA